MICHVKCATNVPQTCGLPQQFLEQFNRAMNTPLSPEPTPSNSMFLSLSLFYPLFPSPSISLFYPLSPSPSISLFISSLHLPQSRSFIPSLHLPPSLFRTLYPFLFVCAVSRYKCIALITS